MAGSSIQDDLNSLRECVREATKRGGFLLSTNRVSDYWLVINDLRTPQVVYLVSRILQVCLPHIQREDQMVAIFAPKLTRTTEDHFPWSAVRQKLDSRTPPASTITGEEEFSWSTVMARLGSQISLNIRQTLQYYELDFHREEKDLEKVVNIPVGATAGVWLGIFSISPHVDLITSAVDSIRHHKRDIKTILVVIERDNVTRQRLQERGVRLVPLIVCDDRGGPKTVLEMNQPPYTDYHKYFTPGGTR